jgi:acetoin utilization deacetylase AcuC-like enzyme
MVFMDSRTLIVRDPRFREHVAPDGHPERPERLDAIDRALTGLADQLREAEPRSATDEEILRVHTREHLAGLQGLEGRTTHIDADTYVSSGSMRAARLAAGSSIELAMRIARGEARNALGLVRPPGHHAERTRPMGFCLINNVAIALEGLRQEAGMERIAVVDWDVHHGNGTQHIFEAERDVLFLSLHQFPFYPGTGALHEQGMGDGEGATVNLPMPAGCGDAEYGAVFRELVTPILQEFRPEILLVSAGFDAHVRDPLASMQVSSQGFGAFASELRHVAEDTCAGRMLLILEGGYDLRGLGDAVAEVAQVLLAEDGRAARFPSPTPLGRQLVARFREAHAAHWQALGEEARPGF